MEHSNLETRLSNLDNLTDDDVAFINTVQDPKIIEECYNLLASYVVQRPDTTMMIICDIAKIDKMWQRTRTNRISDFDTLRTKTTGKKKYVQSRRDLLNLKVSRPPEIYISNYDNMFGKYTEFMAIYFRDGRHRFANMRDMGAVKIPVIIDKTNYELFKCFLYEDN